MAAWLSQLPRFLKATDEAGSNTMPGPGCLTQQYQDIGTLTERLFFIDMQFSSRYTASELVRKQGCRFNLHAYEAT